MQIIREPEGTASIADPELRALVEKTILTTPMSWAIS